MSLVSDHCNKTSITIKLALIILLVEGQLVIKAKPVKQKHSMPVATHISPFEIL